MLLLQQPRFSVCVQGKYNNFEKEHSYRNGKNKEDVCIQVRKEIYGYKGEGGISTKDVLTRIEHCHFQGSFFKIAF